MCPSFRDYNIVNRTVYFLFKAVKRCQKSDLSEEPRGQVVELRRLQTGNIHCYKSFGGFGCTYLTDDGQHVK